MIFKENMGYLIRDDFFLLLPQTFCVEEKMFHTEIRMPAEVPHL